jgi:hypothetical protein
MPLDANGTPTGPPVKVPDCQDCFAPAPTGSDISFLDRATPGRLVTVSTSGQELSMTMLRVSPHELLGTRVVFPDESFLLVGYIEGCPNNETFAQHFSADGHPLAPSVNTLAIPGCGPTGPVQVMPTLAAIDAGVLAAWVTFSGAQWSIATTVLSRDGEPLAPATALSVTTAAGIDGLSLGSLPGGGAILAWAFTPDVEAASPAKSVMVLAVGPDGKPRGRPTPVGTYEAVGSYEVVGFPFPVLSADGRCALLLFDAAPQGGTHGIHAVPLTCVE